MATHDYVLDNATGANFRSDLNNALAAIVSNNSSSSEPSTKYAYQWWADTSAGVLKIRNSANDGWVTLLQLDGTLTLEDGSNSAPALGFRDDLDTGVFSSAANNFDITTGGTTRVNVSSTGINVTGTVVDDGATHDGDVTFTGASANIVFDKSDNQFEFADGATAEFGTGGDFDIFHDGTENRLNCASSVNLRVTTDQLIVNNAANNEEMLKAIANGACELYFDAAKKAETVTGGFTVTGTCTATTFSGSGSSLTALNIVTDTSPQLGSGLDTNGNHISFPDSTGTGNNRLRLGAGADLMIYHDSSENRIESVDGVTLRVTVSTLEFRSADANELMINAVQNAAVKLYYDSVQTFETSANGIIVRGPEGGAGQVFINADEGDDFADIFRLQTDTSGVFTIANGASGSYETNIECNGNGNVELYFDNSKKFQTTSAGATVTGALTLTSNLFMSDNDQIKLGDSQDLLIYHDGNDSYIDDAGVGSLLIRTTTNSNVSIKSSSNFMAKFMTADAVELYYDGSKKFETTSAGVSSGGTISDGKGDVRKVFKNEQTSTYTLVAADSGKAVGAENTVTIPASVFSNGDLVTIYNNTSGNITLTQGSGLTMYFTGDGSTGNRTLGARGMSTVYFPAGTTAFISGSGLT